MIDIGIDKKELGVEKWERLFKLLKDRFEKNLPRRQAGVGRHMEIEWKKVQEKLEASPKKLWSLNEMERTGGEPDLVGYDKKTDEYIFYDCSEESPKDRRSLCYDGEALRTRKENKPRGSAIEMAAEMGIEILTEEECRQLQELGKFDTKTQSWIKTPNEIRKLGGAIFCDRRYDHVFTYHNGAESYYAARGFRGKVKV